MQPPGTEASTRGQRQAPAAPQGQSWRMRLHVSLRQPPAEGNIQRGRKRFPPRPAHHTALRLCVRVPATLYIPCILLHGNCLQRNCPDLPLSLHSSSTLRSGGLPKHHVGSRHSPAPSHLQGKASFSLACDLTPVWPKGLRLRPHSPYRPVPASPDPQPFFPEFTLSLNQTSPLFCFSHTFLSILKTKQIFFPLGRVLLTPVPGHGVYIWSFKNYLECNR